MYRKKTIERPPGTKVQADMLQHKNVCSRTFKVVDTHSSFTLALACTSANLKDILPKEDPRSRSSKPDRGNSKPFLVGSTAMTKASVDNLRCDAGDIHKAQECFRKLVLEHACRAR
jgi:hypothetical protein